MVNWLIYGNYVYFKLSQEEIYDIPVLASTLFVLLLVGLILLAKFLILMIVLVIWLLAKILGVSTNISPFFLQRNTAAQQMMNLLQGSEVHPDQIRRGATHEDIAKLQHRRFKSFKVRGIVEEYKDEDAANVLLLHHNKLEIPKNEFQDDFFNQRPKSSRRGSISTPQLKKANYFKVPEFQKDSSCIICFNKFKDSDTIIVLPCYDSHVFHEKCIENWLQRNDSCPLCKKSIKEQL